MLDTDVPSSRDTELESFDDEIEQIDLAAEGSGPERSLSEDIDALIDDGKTYVEAELAYQKTRLSYVAGNGKSGIGFALAALAFLHLALIGLVVGVVLTLAPHIGPLWATLAVVAVLLLGVVIFGFAAKKRFSKAAGVFQDDGK
ncbi:phage holin family protein [Pontixanthobacter aquaemixtae]|uniref:Phage holin family protein n=1 Tax=Pontixanthobacter aquaemixtae TaxID=1958940 RepID=A0A844ZST0_9SPHN|nr:phage holin family protein [Pontixanthobacter aquaemixtae]MXO90180.1 phage holin family protein [Pontixanthobacter aquaemixtae]